MAREVFQRTLPNGNLVVSLVSEIEDGDFSLNQSADKALEKNQSRLHVGEWNWLSQEHGTEIVWLATNERASGVKGDALITASKQKVISVTVADCLPLLLVEESGIMGLLHLGWRGIEQGLLEKSIQTIRKKSVQPITAVLGPTNTGKTHLAVETMLEYESGIIGFPLRLLAREIFDKCVNKIGQEKVALITGASSGLGRHFSKTLSEAGATVILSARRMDNLVELQKELNGKSHIFSLDVTSTESVKKLFEEIKKEFGSADILVNNAGVNDTRKFKDLDEQSWNYVLETNLNGAYRVAKTFTDLLLEQKKPGSVINIASILGLRVGLNLTSYAAAKAGLVQLTKSMALELARSGIRVNAIAPGYILTEINDDFFKTEEGQSYIKSIPMNRLGIESELDGLLLLLASDASSFMTGSIIPVDGGHLVNPL